MRLRFNLDCDGILADFAAGACEQIFTVTGRRYDPAVITTWEVFSSIPDEAHVKEEVYNRMKAEGGCLSLPIYDGAKEAVAELRELVDITIVTSPFSGSKVWMYERELWLAEHFGIHADDIIHAKKKHAIHADFFLDDKESHVDEWEKYWRSHGHNPFGMLWHMGRNTAPAPHIKVVNDWQTVIRLVKMCTTLREGLTRVISERDKTVLAAELSMAEGVQVAPPSPVFELSNKTVVREDDPEE